MNHEPKSASIGMLSTATRTTATVSPLTPSPINGSLVPNGSPAASSALSVQSAPSSSFAAALRKLAKQAEEPREKLKEPSPQTAKPVQHSLHQPPPAPPTHHSVPSLISAHAAFPPPNTAAAAALLAQRTQEEEKWLARQRRLRQEKEDRQYQVSEFRQQVLEQQLDMSGRPINPSEPELRPENLSSCRVISNRNEGCVREPLQHFGGPPPLISPKPQQPTPTSLWNPVSLMETTTEPRRTQEPTTVHTHATAMYEHNRQTVASIKIERPFSFEKQQDEEELAHRRREMEKYQPIRDSSTLEHAGYSHAPFLAELEKSTQTFLNQQRSSLQQAGQTMEITLHKPSTALRAPPPRTREPMYIYDEFLQQHRKLVSKLDLEERRRKEAREKGKT
ncbi:hypothetical protein AB205_0133850, partial [Aquarana catesbeiana]